LASTVYASEDILLQDDTQVTLKPLSIKGLRKFMDKMSEFENVNDENEGMDLLVDAAAICLMKTHPQYWDKTKENKKGERVGGFAEEFEDVVDMPTVYKILDVCGGGKLNDPNLVAAAMEAVGKN